jgi:hypothetical protein
MRNPKSPESWIRLQKWLRFAKIGSDATSDTTLRPSPTRNARLRYVIAHPN